MNGTDYQPQPPKLFAWIASVDMISLIIITQFLEKGNHLWLRGTGVFVLLLAAIFIFAPFYLLTRYGKIKDGESYVQSSVVVDQGLYAIIRHPQYLGYSLLASGFTLLSQHWVAVILAAVGVMCFYLQARKEEKYCLAQCSLSYQQYCQQVPGFNIFLGALRLLRGRDQ